MKPQCEAVLRELRARKLSGLTQAEASRVVGTSRLAARIADLRAYGYRIESELVTVPTRGAPARVARYVLVEKPEQQRLGLTA